MSISSAAYLPRRDVALAIQTGGIARDFGLKLEGEREFGGDYAETLRQWRQSFEAAWPRLMPLGFDEQFRRLWRYYLCYCEAGFDVGTIDVRQIVYRRPA